MKINPVDTEHLSLRFEHVYENDNEAKGPNHIIRFSNIKCWSDIYTIYLKEALKYLICF